MEQYVYSLILISILYRSVHSICYGTINKKSFVVHLSREKQREHLHEAMLECYKQMNISRTYTKGSRCPIVFDGVMCWPDTEAGEVRLKSCPDYINGFNTLYNARRTCLPNGQWFYNSTTNRTWTDYRDCIKPLPKSILPDHLPRIKVLYYVGYGMSLVSLLLAVIIMVSFKRLHCERNIIHINLFISFILRAIICFIKDVEFVQDGDVSFKNNSYHLQSEGNSWGCKFLYTLFHYLLTANYAWIFTEGVYLHIVIFETTQHKKRLCKLIIISGWCAPLFCVIPWAIVRAVYEDSLCWNTHDDADNGYYWIMKGPIVASIIINFILFINVIRVLFTKLSAYNIRDPKRYKKLTKATLILIPLFGVHFITFIAIPNCLEEHQQIIRLYIEMTLISFQGFIIALLVCFLNREVRAEFKKKWERHLLRNQSLNSYKSYKSQTEVIKLETSPKPETRIKATMELQMYKATGPVTHDHQNGLLVAL